MSRFDLGQARWIAFWVGILLLVGCAVTGTEGDDAGAGTEGPVEGRAPFESSYTPQPTKPVVIRGATVLTGTGVRLERADVVLRDGLIAVIGSAEVPPGAEIVDGSGKWVTPGIIDVHSHLGDYPAPSARAHSDSNESTSPNTAEVWAEHSVWPQDPQFPRALAGGVTTLQVLPGSANLFGGRGVTLKNVPSRTVQGMKFPGAPHGLKMACGENPKRTYGRRNRSPSTRMGNVAGYRKAWIDAADYRRKIAEDPDDPPKRDLKLETLAGVLDGQAASTALPPRWKIMAPAVAPSGLPVIATQWVPCSTGLMVRWASAPVGSSRATTTRHATQDVDRDRVGRDGVDRDGIDRDR